MRLVFLLLFISLLSTLSAQTTYNFYVSPTGDDNNTGLLESSPFASLEKARDEAQTITGNTEITIWFLDGDYFLTQPFTLGAADSGSVTKKIIYRAQNKHKAKLHLNRQIPVSDFQNVTDPALINRMRPEAVGQIKMLDLSTLGLTNVNTWPDFFSADNQELIRIYAGDDQLPLSQYPNDTMMTMKKVTQNEPGIFEFRGTRHHNWLEAVNDGLWFQGYWRVAWQFDAVRTSSIDTTNGLVYQATSVPLGIGSKYHRPEGNGEEPYKAINLLEEIDLPGEWCIHFSTQKLYIWIPSGTTEIQLLDLEEPIIETKDVSYTTFRDLDISYSLGNGIVIENGEHNLIAGCDISKCIDDAVQIINGTDHGVQSNDMHHLGAGGVLLSGGDRYTLTPANHYAVNNHIYEFGQVKVIYAPAIYTHGRTADNNVGMYVAHNKIHGTPHVGILFSGNNHIFEYNEIYDICRVSNDMGAFYSWADWTSYGSVLRYNYIHDAHQAHGMYFDDGDSGDSVYHNIMHDIDVGVFIGGGHDNIVFGNLAVNCEKTVHIDNRGVSRGYNLSNTTLVNRVLSVDYQNAPWSVQYPSIVNILDVNYSQELPVGNDIDCNMAINTSQVVDIDAATATDWEVILGTNYSDTDSDLSDPSTVTLNDILAASGFNGESCMDDNVDWSTVGLVADIYRAQETLPIELLSFNGENKGITNHLFWTTATEENNRGFEIERSLDGITFETIGFIEGKGTTSQKSNYLFIDESLKNGVHYYRLKQLDFNGEFERSKIIQILVNENSFAIGFPYPNPNKNQLIQIDYFSDEVLDIEIQFLDVTGKSVLEKRITIQKGNHSLDVDCTSLKKGIYIIQLNTSKNTISRKIILE